jgi:hypothetical protein
MCLSEAGYPDVEVMYSPDGTNVGVLQGAVPPEVWWRTMATLRGPVGTFPCFDCWRSAVFGGDLSSEAPDNRSNCAATNEHPNEDGRPSGPSADAPMWYLRDLEVFDLPRRCD